MRTVIVIAAASSLLRVCSHREEAAQPMLTPPGMGTAAAMIPEHGGAIAVSGGLTAEVAPQPDGRILAYLRDPQQAPLTTGEVHLSVRRPDGALQPVAVHYDPTVQAYVGRPGGLPPGSYPVQIAVQAAPSAPPIELLTPPVQLLATTTLPGPHHGGRVEIVGDHAVETVVARNGDVALFWTDLEGQPIPPAQVTLPTVQVTVNSRPHVVPTRIVDGHFVAHVPVVVPSANVVVGFPSVVVAGVPYAQVIVPRPVIVAALPTVLIAPTAVVAAAPTVVVGGHVPNGRAHGWWRNHGGFVVGAAAPSVVVAPPSVVIAPPGPPAVFIGGGVSFGGGWGHGHGHGHHGH